MVNNHPDAPEPPTEVILREIKWCLEGTVHDLEVAREKLERRQKQFEKLSRDYNLKKAKIK